MSNLQEIKIERKEAEDAIAMGEALAKLEKNSAFKKLILKGFFEDQAVLMAPLVGSPNEAARKGATNILVGIGALQSYLNQVHRQSLVAKEALEALEEAELEELAAEE